MLIPIRRDSSFPRTRESSVVAILALVLTLSGCGFALRGSVDLPVALQTLQVESPNPDSGIVREVRRMLRNNAVTLTEAPTDERPLGRLTPPRARSVGIPVESHGPSVEALERALDKEVP